MTLLKEEAVLKRRDIISIFLILVLIQSCNFAQMDYIPTDAQIKERLDEFVIEGATIKGLYGNYDVDSLIFESKFDKSKKISPSDMMILILSNAKKNNWNLINQSSRSLDLNKVQFQGKFYSLEHVRIIMKEEPLILYIAWIQADSTKKITDIKETTEISFAEQVLWPKLEYYVNRKPTY